MERTNVSEPVEWVGTRQRGIQRGIRWSPRWRRAQPDTQGEALAVTSLDGTLLAATARFVALMGGEGLSPHPDALARDGAAALSLFHLRRRAMADGRAQSFVPPRLFVVLERQGEELHYRLEQAAVTEPLPPELAPHAAALVDALPAPMAVLDTHGAIVAANRSFGAVVGEGSDLAQLVSAGARERARLLELGANRSEGRLEAASTLHPQRILRLTSRPYPVNGSAVLVAVSDVTEQAALEAHVFKGQKMQAVGELAGNIAHDFNNVLAAIMGFSDLLLQNHRPSDPAFNDIMNIKQSAQRAARLVKQLLAFSRRQTLRPTVIDLNGAIADMATMLDRLLGERVRLSIAYGRDLWPVLADLAQVEQVVINLAVNARDAMPAGGTLTIRTANVPGSAAEGDEGPLGSDAVLIEVEDEGTGMPDHVKEKIFEPFFTTKAPGDGTGLGLSTVYGVVKQTGGTLSVESAEGQGTTFRVYLPRTEPAAVAMPAEPQAREAAGGDPAKAQERASRPGKPAGLGAGAGAASSATPIPASAPVSTAPVADLTGSATLLIVEDEEAVRAFAARALAAKGYQVLQAASGVEALEVYADADGAVDLLLSDVIMPELDGPSLVRRLRAERPDLKVIFMSGYADGAGLDDMGDVEFLEKPFTLKALAEAVKRELGGAATLAQS